MLNTWIIQTYTRFWTAVAEAGEILAEATADERFRPTDARESAGFVLATMAKVVHFARAEGEREGSDLGWQELEDAATAVHTRAEWLALRLDAGDERNRNRLTRAVDQADRDVLRARKANNPGSARNAGRNARESAVEARRFASVGWVSMSHLASRADYVARQADEFVRTATI